MSSSIFALVESDELQRLCSADAIQAIGYDCVHFKTPRDLSRALERGAGFDAAGIALHPRTPDERREVLDICRQVARDAERPVLFMAHATELEILKPSLREFLAQPGTDFICTPMQDEELRLRLDLLARKKRD
ncbi:MAG: hypothetical protein AAGD03_21985 [Bordetella sp.]|nr:hypothetical protein [Pseudomonadota bacterium]